MSSHYIDLICPAPDCTRSEGIYTGSVLTDYFEAALDYEGATIDARCDEHSNWVDAPTPDPTLHACHVDESAGMDPAVNPPAHAASTPTTPCDVCGIAFGPGERWYHHARLNVYVHPSCAADFPVRGEDITTHTVLWGQVPDVPEVTAAMKAEDVDTGLVERMLIAAFSMPSEFAREHPGVVGDLVVAYGDQYRRALAAVLPEIQAQALQDAADVLYGDERAEGPLWHSLSVQTWLRDRAARLTATSTEEPTDG